MTRKGLPDLESIGGRWYRCTSCGQAIQAECLCCEPPRHTCAEFAAALLGRRGGQAGRGKAKRRGDSDYYRKLRKGHAGTPSTS